MPTSWPAFGALQQQQQQMQQVLFQQHQFQQQMTTQEVLPPELANFFWMPVSASKCCALSFPLLFASHLNSLWTAFKREGPPSNPKAKLLLLVSKLYKDQKITLEEKGNYKVWHYI